MKCIVLFKSEVIFHLHLKSTDCFYFLCSETYYVIITMYYALLALPCTGLCTCTHRNFKGALLAARGLKVLFSQHLACWQIDGIFHGCLASFVGKLIFFATSTCTSQFFYPFLPHISNMCKTAVTQLNVLQRLKSFIGFKEKTVLWSGIFHPLYLFRTLKNYMNVL